jgi:hypothetical protein
MQTTLPAYSLKWRVGRDRPIGFLRLISVPPLRGHADHALAQ